MGATAKEGVLKLVHPRRHVETYRNPVKASEILRKYPRHCLTRPDVFIFPWIVVHPDSILLPGKVYLIVHHRTLYRLIKDRSQTNEVFSSEVNHSYEYHSLQFLLRGSPFVSDAESFPRLHDHGTEDISSNVLNLHHTGCWFGRKSRINHEWIVCANAHHRMKQQQPQAFTAGTKIPRIHAYPLSSSREHVTRLKSCMKKPESVRKRLHLGASFEISSEAETWQSKRILSTRHSQATLFDSQLEI